MGHVDFCELLLTYIPIIFRWANYSPGRREGNNGRVPGSGWLLPAARWSEAKPHQNPPWPFEADGVVPSPLRKMVLEGKPSLHCRLHLQHGIQGGMGLGCLFAIRTARTVTGSFAFCLRNRATARFTVRSSSPRKPSSRSTKRLRAAVSTSISCQQRSRIRRGGALRGPKTSRVPSHLT